MKIVKIVKNMAAQGDVLFRRVDALPSNAKRVENNGPIVVAHSETGHNHQIDHGNGIAHFTVDDPMVCYLQADGVFGDVVHHRAFDTHETLRLDFPSGGGVFEVRRQREHTPEGWRRVED